MSLEAMTPKEIMEAVQASTPLISPRCCGRRLALSILVQMARLIELEEEYKKLKEDSNANTNTNQSDT